MTLLEIYQLHFFQPRCLDVFIATGQKRTTGGFTGDKTYLDEPPVEIGQPMEEPESDSSSSESDSDEDEDLCRLPKQERKSIKAARKYQRQLSKYPSKKYISKLRDNDKETDIQRRQQFKLALRQVRAHRLAPVQEEKENGTFTKKSM